MNRQQAKASAEQDKVELTLLAARNQTLSNEIAANRETIIRINAMLPIKEAFAAGKRVEMKSDLAAGSWTEIDDPSFALKWDEYRIVEEPPKKVRDLTPADLPDHPWFRPRNGNPLQPMLMGETQVDFGGTICIRTFQHMRNEGWEFSTSHKGPWSKCEVSE